MKWTKMSFRTTNEAVDLVSSMLDDLGIEGIEIEDNIPLTEEERKTMFIDLFPEPGSDDGTSLVSFYLDPEVDKQETIDMVVNGLNELEMFIPVGDKNIIVSETEDKDWINNWKEFFKPFRVGEDIIIKPTWEELVEKKDGDLVIEIDPGIAFGTGSHETTKLCILALKKHLKKGDRVLDIGCGSGILSIASIKLGAEYALGTDIDPNAIVATNENTVVNKITDKEFSVLCGNIIDDEKMQEEVGMECYDIVVANILADVIMPLSAEVLKHLKSNGLFVTSGILQERKKEVLAAMIKNGLTIFDQTEMGDWVSIVAKK